MIRLKPITAKYFELIEEEITLHDFDNWVLANDWLETELEENLYFDIISLNYNNPNTTHKLGKLLKNHFDNGEFETLRLLELLEAIITQNGKEANALIRMYDLYCRGYHFLRELGLNIGLNIGVPTEYNVDWFHELNEEEQHQLVAAYYPLAKNEAMKVKDLLLDKTIILTGKQDDVLNYWQYLDKRDKK